MTYIADEYGLAPGVALTTALGANALAVPQPPLV
jgi:hypothetical protein